MKQPDLSLLAAKELVSCLAAEVMGRPVKFRVERDVKQPEDGRIFVQCWYRAKCSVTGRSAVWHGRKWYLSDHMTDDEVVKTCYAAFKATVEHEVMEGFTCLGERVFNPHASYEALIQASRQEVYREPSTPSRPFVKNP